MKLRLLFAFLLLLAVVERPVERKRDMGRPSASERAAWKRLRVRGNNLFYQHKYLEAARLYERGYKEAVRHQDAFSAGRFLGNIGSCQFATLQYRAAARAFLEARALAEEAGDQEMIATASLNLCSLYSQLGELNAALQAAQHGLKTLGAAGDSRNKAAMLTQAAVLYARRGDWETAYSLFLSALNLTDGFETAQQTRASICEMLGWELLERGQLDAAEHALLEAYRLRKFACLPDLEYSYYELGMLYLAKGAPKIACRFLNLAMKEGQRVPGALPVWRIRYQRGRALAMLGRFHDALEELGRALDRVRRWRVELLPAGSFFISTAAEVQQVYSAYVEAACSLYYQTFDRRFLHSAFQATEENRAVGLRALLNSPSDWQAKLPEQYWKTLAELRQLDISGDSQELTATRASYLEGRLAEMEAAYGLAFPQVMVGTSNTSGSTSVADIQRNLHSGEAYLSFHLGDRESWAWGISAHEVRLQRLPSGTYITSLAQRFEAAVRESRSESVLLGQKLYAVLFGSFGSNILRQRHWLLAPDEILFTVPFAALVSGTDSGKPVYLIQRHTLEVVPSGAFLSRRAVVRFRPEYLGVGDPIYNSADPRCPRPVKPAFVPLASIFRAGNARTPFQLNRIPGSSREIHVSARAWSPDRSHIVLLEGSEAARARVLEHLGRSPEIVHFATHFLSSPYNRRWGTWPEMHVSPLGSQRATAAFMEDHHESLIVLGLETSGDVSLLGPAEISRLPIRSALVVLSGCSSGVAEVAPGTGLLGLTHAWLTAGAHTVAASLWPVQDDLAEFFGKFYGQLRILCDQQQPHAVPEALAGAQVEMLRKGDWRSLPVYWGAYFCIGKG